MSLTIHAIGDFGWFSQRNTAPSYGSVIRALYSHYRYVKSKASAVWNDNFLHIFWRAKAELRKRWDSRIALKFWIAVPKDWREEEALKRVVAFVSEQLNIPLENVSAYYHPHPNNPHIHLLIYPRTKKGKKLRINRKELKEFHKAWDIYLRELGYHIKRYKDLGLSVPIWLLKSEVDFAEEYGEFLELRKELAKEIAELNAEVVRRKEERKYDAKEISDDEVERVNRMQEQNRRKISLPGFLKRMLGRQNDEKELSFKEKQKVLARFQLAKLGFKNDDKVAIVLIKEGEKPEQKIVFASKIYEEDGFLNYLAYKNSQGYNVYFSIHKLKPRAKSRKKQDFCEKQNVIALDIDGDKLGVNGFELLKKIVRDEKLPAPTLVVKTSAENYQAYWVLKEPVEAEKIEQVVQSIAKKYGLDFVQDISRVMRLAGFFNRKTGKGNFVSAIWDSKEVEFEPFKKFLPKPKLVPKIEQKIKELEKKRDSLSSIGQTREPKWGFEAYKEYADTFLSLTLHGLASAGVLAELEEFFSNWQAGIYRIRSISELEFVIADRINKVLAELTLPTETRYTILRHFLTLSLAKIRPHKLKKSPQYPIITACKVIFGTYKPELAGKFEFLAQKNKELMKKIRIAYDYLRAFDINYMDVEKEAERLAKEYGLKYAEQQESKQKKEQKQKKFKTKQTQSFELDEDAIIKQKAKERAEEIARRLGSFTDRRKRRRRR